MNLEKEKLSKEFDFYTKDIYNSNREINRSKKVLENLLNKEIDKISKDSSISINKSKELLSKIKSERVSRLEAKLAFTKNWLIKQIEKETLRIQLNSQKTILS